MRNGRTVTGGVACVLLAASIAAAQEPMSGDEINETIEGKRVYLAVPLGGEFPLLYRSDGQVEGSGEAFGLGRYMQPEDTGRWWVEGDRLCQQWQEWYDGKQFCFTLIEDEPGRLRWTRDDGFSGEARVVTN